MTTSEFSLVLVLVLALLIGAVGGLQSKSWWWSAGVAAGPAVIVVLVRASTAGLKAFGVGPLSAWSATAIVCLAVTAIAWFGSLVGPRLVRGRRD